MTPTILLILPTRNRHWDALECMASAMKRATGHCEIRHKSYITDCYITPPQSGTGEGFVANVNANGGGYTWRWEDYQYVGWIGDDCRFLTNRWDEKLLAHKELIVYGPDGIHDERLATHPFVRSIIPKTLGWLIPPTLKHFHADSFIMALGKELGSIAYDPEIQIEHRHWTVGKSQKDETAERNYSHLKDDEIEWRDNVFPRIPEYAKKIREAM